MTKTERNQTTKSGLKLYTTTDRHGKMIKVTIPEDAENPDFAFQTLSTRLLVEFNDPKVDVRYYIRKELANRGVDLNGIWIGFEAAKKLHRIL